MGEEKDELVSSLMGLGLYMSLDGKTPVKKCGIKIEETNKRLTIIQNASSSASNSG